MININVKDAVAIREAGYKSLINKLGIEDTIRFMRHFYDEAANKEEHQKPDISWEQFLNEIKKI